MLVQFVDEVGDQRRKMNRQVESANPPIAPRFLFRSRLPTIIGMKWSCGGESGGRATWNEIQKIGDRKAWRRDFRFAAARWFHRRLTGFPTAHHRAPCHR